MNIDVLAHDNLHHLGESATHPIDLRCDALAALLVVAGIEPAPPRALPKRRITAHSGAFNYRI